MTERINRKACKEEVRTLLRTAQVSPKKLVALYLLLGGVLDFLGWLGGGGALFTSGQISPFFMFSTVLSLLLSIVLNAGFVLYCMTVRREERAEYTVLSGGFPVAGKIILLTVVTSLLIVLWSLLFIIPGIIAAYRYQFALYNLLENPELGVMEAIRMSRYQTQGYKGQLFLLDMSYLGWTLLASLPSLVYRQVIQMRISQIVGLYGYWNLEDVMQYVDPNVFGIPPTGWQILIFAWSLVVSMYYLANYRCAELAYFETAKRTSGVGQTSFRQGTWDGFGGSPDGGSDGGYGF